MLKETKYFEMKLWHRMKLTAFSRQKFSLISKDAIKGKEIPMEDISLNDNLIIKGNNLLSLYTLKEKYQDKIKLIYSEKFSCNSNQRQLLFLMATGSGKTLMMA